MIHYPRQAQCRQLPIGIGRMLATVTGHIGMESNHLQGHGRPYSRLR